MQESSHLMSGLVTIVIDVFHMIGNFRSGRLCNKPVLEREIGDPESGLTGYLTWWGFHLKSQQHMHKVKKRRASPVLAKMNFSKT